MDFIARSAAWLSFGLAFAPGASWASDPIVAVDAATHGSPVDVIPAPPAPGEPDSAPVAAASSVPRGMSALYEPTPRKSQGDVQVGMSLYGMQGGANDDFDPEVIALLLRPSLELHVAFRVREDEYVKVGGSTLAIELFVYRDRTSTNYPALLGVGYQANGWLLELMGGASLFSNDSEGAFSVDGDEDALPSPRVELRAGWRFKRFVELRLLLGTERRIAPLIEDVSRTYLGVAFGVGGVSSD